MRLHAGFFALTFAGLLLCVPLAGQQTASDSPPSTLTNESYVKMEGNDVGIWIANNGSMSHNPLTDASGFEWPLGSLKYLLYQEGLLFGGKVMGEVRIEGSTYRYGLQAGPIRPDGTPEDPSNPRFRVYRVRQLDRSEYNRLQSAEQQQLRTDFLAWPVDDGAPWVDADSNGTYEPDFDAWLNGSKAYDTPVFPGREVLWYVANDLNPSRTTTLYGSPPLGLEFQVLAWSGSGSAVEERTVFVRYTIINKSINTITDAYIARWVDPDVGDASDDLVGVDTTLNMMYAYNGSIIDDVYDASPPAVGITWLQTPAVPSPGSTARWGDGLREGYRNIPMSAFAFYINSDPIYQDPDLGVPIGSVQMYNYLTGVLYDGQPYVDPVSSETVTFPLAGDPLSATGWTDAIVHPPDDRRMMSSCGPFTLARGDTQQVVLSTTVGLGSYPSLAVQDLRHSARKLQREYIDGITELSLAEISHALTWPEEDRFALTVSSARAAPLLRQLVAVVRSRTGEELLRFQLYDDGQHGDVGADDGVYANTLTHAALQTGGDLFIAAVEGNDIREETLIAEMLPLAGDAGLSAFTILSDHLDFNGAASPGENVICGLTLSNRGAQELGGWSFVSQIADDASFARISETIAGQESLEIDGLTPGIGDLLQFDIPADAQPGSTVRMPLLFMSDQYCLWRDTVEIPVTAPSRPQYTGLLEHVDGPAFGTLGYTVVDPAALPEQSIRVSVQGDDFGAKTLTVRDHRNQVLADNVPLPDAYGHRTTTVAGLRLLSGSATMSLEKRQDGTVIPEPLHWYFDEPRRAWFDPYAGYLTYGFNFFGSSITSLFDIPPVMLEFDRTAPRKAYVYLRGGSPDYGYQGYFDGALRAFDMSDSTNPRPLSVAFVEQNGSAAHDSTWYPTRNPGDREYLSILDEMYSETPNPAYMVPFNDNAGDFPILYSIWPLLVSDTLTFEDGDRYHIIPRVPISSRDTYMLDMTTVGARRDAPPLAADAAMLYPNYPNPFSGVTRVAWRLRTAGHAELAVYDALGRKLRTVESGWKDAGMHVSTLALDGARPGVYYCRLTAGGRTITRRMVLLR